jgi:hypothetical protein
LGDSNILRLRSEFPKIGLVIIDSISEAFGELWKKLRTNHDAKPINDLLAWDMDARLVAEIRG